MNRGLGFIGFWLIVAWFILLLRVGWQIRVSFRDRFEYISVALTPLKLNVLGWCFGWVFWSAILGEIWWFVDAEDVTLQLLVTVFVDGLCRPLTLAFLGLIWSLPLATYVNVDVDQLPPTSETTPVINAPGAAIATTTVSQGLDRRLGQLSAALAESTTWSSASDNEGSATRVGGRHRRDRGRGLRIGSTNLDDIGGFSVPVQQRVSFAVGTPTGVSHTQHPPAESGGVLEWLVATMTDARAFFAGEPTLSRHVHSQQPWEVGARWSMSVQMRWVLLGELIVSVLFVVMAILESSKPLVYCSQLRSPETGGCKLLVASTHIIVIRPRVFSVMTLFIHSALFVVLCHSGRSHLKRIGHMASRAMFFRTLCHILACEGVSIFCLWCRMFNTVRYAPVVVFFTFCEDVSNQVLLWSLVQHLSTAGPRPNLPEPLLRAFAFLEAAMPTWLSRLWKGSVSVRSSRRGSSVPSEVIQDTDEGEVDAVEIESDPGTSAVDAGNPDAHGSGASPNFTPFTPRSGENQQQYEHDTIPRVEHTDVFLELPGVADMNTEKRSEELGMTTAARNPPLPPPPPMDGEVPFPFD